MDPLTSWRWIFIALFLANLHTGQSQLMKFRSMVVMNRAEIADNPKYITSTIKVYPMKMPNTGYLHDYEGDLLQRIDQAKVNVVFLVRMKENLEVAVYNRTVDLCSFLRRPSERLFKMVLDDLRQHGRMPVRCPVLPGKYFFRNSTFSSIQPPAFLPEGQFHCDVKVTNDHEQILKHRWFGRLKKIY